MTTNNVRLYSRSVCYGDADLIEFEGETYMCAVPAVIGESPDRSPKKWLLIEFDENGDIQSKLKVNL